MTVQYQPPRPGHQPPPYQAPPLPHSSPSLANYGPPVSADYTGTPLPKKSFMTPVVAVWSVLGGLAAGYLAYLAVAPEAQLVPGSAGISDQRFAARLNSEVSTIKESIAKVQLELAKLRTDVAGQDARGKFLGEQIATLERKVTGEPAAEVEASAPQPAPAATPTGKTAPKSAPVDAPADVEAKAATPAKPRVVNAEPALSAADLGLETGSVADEVAPAAPAKPAKAAAKTVAAAEPIDFGTAVVKPAAKPVGIQISSGASVDSLRLSWSLLADRHAEALKNLEARYVAKGDEASPTYDLIAGPIKSKAEAQKVCKALAAKNVPCKIGDFLGEQL